MTGTNPVLVSRPAVPGMASRFPRWLARALAWGPRQGCLGRDRGPGPGTPRPARARREKTGKRRKGNPPEPAARKGQCAEHGDPSGPAAGRDASRGSRRR